MLTNQYQRPVGNLYRFLDKLASLFKDNKTNQILCGASLGWGNESLLKWS